MVDNIYKIDDQVELVANVGENLKRGMVGTVKFVGPTAAQVKFPIYSKARWIYYHEMKQHETISNDKTLNILRDLYRENLNDPPNCNIYYQTALKHVADKLGYILNHQMVTDHYISFSKKV